MRRAPRPVRFEDSLCPRRCVELIWRSMKDRFNQSADAPMGTISNTLEFYGAIRMCSSKICKFVNREILYGRSCFGLHMTQCAYSRIIIIVNTLLNSRQCRCIDCTFAFLFSSRDACSLRSRLARCTPAFARLCKYTL